VVAAVAFLAYFLLLIVADVQRLVVTGFTLEGFTLTAARSGQFVTLLLALLVIFLGPSNRTTRTCAWLLASVAVFSVTLPDGFGSLWRGLPRPAGLLLWLPHLSSLAVAPIVLTFFTAFPHPLLRRTPAVIALWIPALPMLILQADRMRWMVYEGRAPLALEQWTNLIAATPAVYAAAAVLALIIGYRRESDVTARRRVRVLAFGSMIGLLGIAPIVIRQGRSDAVLDSSVFASPMAAIGILVGLALPASFAYAILRHRLFDVGFIVRRSLQYALARRVVLSIVPLAGATFLLDLWLNRQVPVTDILQRRGWLYAGVAVFAAVARLRRNAWLDGLDRRFFRERYNAQRLLLSIAEDVARTPTAEAAAPYVIAQIEAALHPALAALLVKRPGSRSFEVIAAAPKGVSIAPLPARSTIAGLLPLIHRPLRTADRIDEGLIRQLPREELEWVRNHRIELLVPVRAGASALEAFIALGARRSEEPYSVEDEDLLATVGHAVARLLPREPSPGFSECPVCGCCYEPDTAQCAQDGSALLRQMLSKVLADRYRLTRRIGRGGMGTVYSADDTALERIVAVKVLREDLGDPAAVDRFRVEAQSAAALAHPNVVTVYDIGVNPSGRAFFVMELLQGVALDEELRRIGRFASDRALRLLTGVGAAVRAAHARRIVHRDLKPQNIFLCTSGAGEMPKVLDFGLAKALEISSIAALTQQGMVLGTLRYMSPEQLRGAEASVDADLWAFALIALEMLAGSEALDRPPGTVPRLEGLPEPLRPVFTAALALDPLDRPTSVDEFLDALTNALSVQAKP
jgi:hypothetical protein